MAIAYHTHTFSIPTADAADLLAGTEGGKVITPDVLGPVTAAGKALLSAANAGAQRAALDLEPGTDVQAYDADLTAIGALAKTDGNFIVGDGSTWVAENGATARASLGLTIGTDVQAYDADLSAIAALAKTDGNIIVGDGSTWVAESGATARASLGLTIGTDVQAYDADLAALAGLTSAANKVPYFTGSATAGLLDFKDEDDMASNSATAVPSQQSVKAYVDARNLGVYDVTVYGADPANSAADNLTAFNLAKAAAVAAGGGTLYVPKGVTIPFPAFGSTTNAGTTGMKYQNVAKLDEDNVHLVCDGTITGAVLAYGDIIVGTDYVRQVIPSSGSYEVSPGVTTLPGDFSAYTAGDIICIGIQHSGSNNNAFGLHFATVTDADGAAIEFTPATRFYYKGWEVCKIDAVYVADTLSRGDYYIEGDYSASYPAGSYIRIENVDGLDTFDGINGLTPLRADADKAYFEQHRVLRHVAADEESPGSTAKMYLYTSVRYNYDNFWIAPAGLTENVTVSGSGHIDYVTAIGCSKFFYREVSSKALGARYLYEFMYDGGYGRSGYQSPLHVGNSSHGLVNGYLASNVYGFDGGVAAFTANTNCVFSNIVVSSSYFNAPGSSYAFQFEAQVTPYQCLNQDNIYANFVGESAHAIVAAPGSLENGISAGAARNCTYANFTFNGGSVDLRRLIDCQVTNIRTTDGIALGDLKGTNTFTDIHGEFIYLTGFKGNVILNSPVMTGWRATYDASFYAAVSSDFATNEGAIHLNNPVVLDETSAKTSYRFNAVPLAFLNGAYDKVKAGGAYSVFGASSSVVRVANNCHLQNLSNLTATSCGDAVALTIASGAITLPRLRISRVVIDTEAAAATDDLDTINGGMEGDTITFVSANSGRDITFKDGTGNIRSAGDMTLSNIQDCIMLTKSGVSWLALPLGDNT